MAPGQKRSRGNRSVCNSCIGREVERSRRRMGRRLLGIREAFEDKINHSRNRGCQRGFMSFLIVFGRGRWTGRRRPRRGSLALERGNPWRRLSFALERGTPLRRIPFALEKGTPLKRIPIAVERGKPLRRISLTLEKGTPLKRIPFAVHGEEEPLEANPIRLEKGTPLKQIPFTRKRGETLEVTPTCLGEGDSLERSRLLSLYRALGTNGS